MRIVNETETRLRTTASSDAGTSGGGGPDHRQRRSPLRDRRRRRCTTARSVAGVRGSDAAPRPLPSRNHRTPTASDTPASTAASTDETPRLIALQNRTRCSRRPAGGRPGDAPPAAPSDSLPTPWPAHRNLLDIECCDDRLNRPRHRLPRIAELLGGWADRQASAPNSRSYRIWDSATPAIWVRRHAGRSRRRLANVRS